MKRPVLSMVIISLIVSFAASIFFSSVGVWWGGMLFAMAAGLALGWYTRAISARVAAFRAGWTHAGRHNKPVDGP